jgi:very-short-patch-repair endonuclease
VDDPTARAPDRATIGVMDPRLEALAERQHGVVSVHDATRLEIGTDELGSLVRRAELVRVRRGAYVLGGAWRGASPEQRLALRTRGILHARGSGVATHQSALALHGLPIFAAPVDVVDIAAVATRSRLAGGLRVHPTDSSVTPGDVDGCRAVPVATALAQVALRHGRDALLVATDAAFHRRLATPAAVDGELGRLATTRRALVRARRWLRLADAAAESAGETRARLLLIDLGHPVRSQVRVRDRDEVVARVDLLVGDRVVVEFDGLVKYEGAEGRAALAAEKRREDRLRELGYEVVRLTWADLARPTHVDALVRRALARAATRGRTSASSR